jgi:osmotically-inducible protein OsmY
MTRTANVPTMSIADEALRSHIEAELEWDPAVPSTCVGVSVTNHTVTLSGIVHTLAHRRAAVKAAQRVKGVHAIVDDITVVPIDSSGTSDADIALTIERILETNTTVPLGVKATVRDGLVVLTGTADHQYQKGAANRAVRDVKGVTGVQNDICVKSRSSGDAVRSKIVSAMHRNADLESQDIQVEVAGREVFLRGHTNSYGARQRAEAAAWAAPGIDAVHNQLTIK